LVTLLKQNLRLINTQTDSSKFLLFLHRCVKLRGLVRNKHVSMVGYIKNHRNSFLKLNSTNYFGLYDNREKLFFIFFIFFIFVDIPIICCFMTGMLTADCKKIKF